VSGISHTNIHVFAMPTYEYSCPKCGHAFELVQSMRDEPLKKCPKCKKTGVKRLIGGGAGLIFKGTGFYITDYKNKKSPGQKEGGGDAKPTEPKAPAPATKPVAPAPVTAPAASSSSAKK
jgi:putative FmdB family regulatory protein